MNGRKSYKQRYMKAAKMVDELLVFSELHRQDYILVDDALEIVRDAVVRCGNPVTAGLAIEMRKRGVLKEGE